MYQDMRSANPLAQGYKKDVIYRFLNKAFINWQAFYPMKYLLVVRLMLQRGYQW